MPVGPSRKRLQRAMKHIKKVRRNNTKKGTQKKSEVGKKVRRNNTKKGTKKKSEVGNAREALAEHIEQFNKVADKRARVEMQKKKRQQQRSKEKAEQMEKDRQIQDTLNKLGLAITSTMEGVITVMDRQRRLNTTVKELTAGITRQASALAAIPSHTAVLQEMKIRVGNIESYNQDVLARLGSTWGNLGYQMDVVELTLRDVEKDLRDRTRELANQASEVQEQMKHILEKLRFHDECHDWTMKKLDH